MPSAGVCIIGNEILTGKFADENGPYLVGRLRTLGVDLGRISVIPDVRTIIADEVLRQSQVFDHVFTTGGVGPTHDDMTFESVALAFGVGVRVHEELATLLDRFRMPRTPENLRMVTLPEGAELLRGDVTGFPVVRVRNVFVLPGVPKLVQQKFEIIAPLIAGEQVRCVRVYSRDHETDVAGVIGEVDAAFAAVDVGSYPRWGEGEHRLIITLESRDDGALKGALEALLPHVDVLRVEGP